MLVGLFLIGFGNGAWDVAMNVQGADVERRMGRSIMSRFHAGYSMGTVGGAAIGAAMVFLHVPVTAHLVGVAVVVVVVVPLAVRNFLADTDHAAEQAEAGGEPRPHVSLPGQMERAADAADRAVRLRVPRSPRAPGRTGSPSR